MNADNPSLHKSELTGNCYIFQRRWLNAYHSRCLRETGEYLKNVRNNQHAYNWLLARVSPIPDTPYWTKLARLTSGSDVIVVSWTCLAAITALATQLLV